MQHYTLSVRDMLDWTEDELWALERPATATLTFDDGEVIDKTDTVDIIISWYYWQIAVRHRELQITRKLFLDGEPFTDDKHRSLLNTAIVDTMETPIDREDVWHIAYRECYNKLYNALSGRLIRYISSTNVPDILELLYDPEIKAANDKATYAQVTIDRAHDAVRNVIETNKYPHNPIVRAVRNRTVPMNQILQSIGPRGRLTDIDSEIFKLPIVRGFAHGFQRIEEYAKESRSAAKALLFNKDPVADAEYFNRKLQLVCSVIRRIVPGDCGSTDYQTLEVPAMVEDEKSCTGRQLVDCLAGLYQVMDDGALREIRKGDYHLCGTSVNFRTTMCCSHLSNGEVCEKCYGVTSYAIPRDTNPGHVSCTAINKLITQLIISTKHLDFIIHKFIAILRGNERKYMETREGHPESIFLAESVIGKPVSLKVRAAEAPHLVNVNYVSDIHKMTVAKISTLNTIDMFTVKDNGCWDEVMHYDMLKHSTRPSLSTEMLAYVRKYGWTVDGDSYVIDLSNWDSKDPMFVYPLKHDSMSEYAIRVERFVRSSTKVGREDSTARKKRKGVGKKQAMLARYRDPNVALYDAHYLISEKLSGVHIGHIATILAATRVVDRTHGTDWNMPSNLHGGMFASHDEIIANRSMSVAMLFEEQYKYFDDLDSYLYKDRPASIMDDLIYIEPNRYV